MPLFDYEQMLFDILHTNNMYGLRTTGPGITEIVLQFMSWHCLKDHKLKDSQMYIVTGPRIELAITLIDRIKRLFSAEGGFGQNRAQTVSFVIKETVIELKRVHIEAYPSQSVDSVRRIKERIIHLSGRIRLNRVTISQSQSNNGDNNSGGPRLGD
jgi:hypothetical protein